MYRHLTNVMAISIAQCFSRRWQRVFLLGSGVAAFLCFWFFYTKPTEGNIDLGLREQKYPLLWRHVHLNNAQGGVSYIPESWLSNSESSALPTSIVDLALRAFTAANSSQRLISNSEIPLIIHQTWKSTKIDRWPEAICEGVETWLEYAAVEGKQSMAYFLWDDEGMLELIRRFEPQLEAAFVGLPKPVERADVFRVVVSNSIGGVYADVDTIPLRAPATWIGEKDISVWEDDFFQPPKRYLPSGPVRLVMGLEADTSPFKDDHWRMGYDYPVQLTQWALAAAPNHPVLNRFLASFLAKVTEIAETFKGDVGSAETKAALKLTDPLQLTGPVAITKASMDELSATNGLRWNALTGIEDGGRSKVVGNTMILPITGFSPGRGKYGNMGSKPITDPDARLQHKAQGSWRKFDLHVEMGKLCRTMFGGCKDWSKVPGGH